MWVCPFEPPLIFCVAKSTPYPATGQHLRGVSTRLRPWPSSLMSGSGRQRSAVSACDAGAGRGKRRGTLLALSSSSPPLSLLTPRWRYLVAHTIGGGAARVCVCLPCPINGLAPASGGRVGQRRLRASFRASRRLVSSGLVPIRDA